MRLRDFLFWIVGVINFINLMFGVFAMIFVFCYFLNQNWILAIGLALTYTAIDFWRHTYFTKKGMSPKLPRYSKDPK